MKTATMPALRVQPELRQAAEKLLLSGESLSAFVEESLRCNVDRRQAQQDFLSRGLTSRDAARKSRKYIAADVVLSKLAAKIDGTSQAFGAKLPKVIPKMPSRQMTYGVRFTIEAEDDLFRPIEFLIVQDLSAARKAQAAIIEAVKFLTIFPFSCRKANAGSSLLRELLIPLGNAGYVALFEIEDANTVTILAVRLQREDDCH